MILPSEDVGEFWHYAFNPQRAHKITTKKTGKWMLFPSVLKVDEVWELIKTETCENRLGCSAKVATARPNALAWDKSARLICVYTYDHEDKEDVFDIRKKLFNLGFEKTIYYKPDYMTSAMTYGKNSWIYRE